MAHLLYSARDGEGKPVEGFVDAASAAEARQQLLAQGLAEVVLHQDATAPTDASRLAGLPERQLRELARVSIAAMEKPGLLPLWRGVARSNRGWLAFDAALVGWGALTASLPLITLGGGLVLLPFALSAWHYRHGGRYAALLKAFAIGDWPRVEELAARLRAVSGRVPNMDFELDVRLAGVEARRGRLPQAVASLAPWRERLAAQPGLFEGRLAAVHAAGEDRAGFVRLTAESHALLPSEPSRVLDHALAQARFGDADLAARLLREVDTALLPPHARGFVAWVDGMVQLRRGAPGAVDQLSAAVAEFLKLSSQPAVWTALAFCTCDHAIALAGAGRRDEARREIAQVWPILRAHGDKPLLRMLQADGLAPP